MQININYMPHALVLAGGHFGAGEQPCEKMFGAGEQPAEKQMFDLFFKVCTIWITSNFASLRMLASMINLLNSPFEKGHFSSNLFQI